MPLSFLLDEHISPVVAEQVHAKRPGIPIQSLMRWRDGAYLNTDDDLILLAAQEDGLTLVTYDTQILSVYASFFEEGHLFRGIVFIDERTIAPNNFGALVRALIYLWDREQAADWQNRMLYLPALPHG